MLKKNFHQAEPIPEEARAYIDALLESGDLFRYHASEDAPVTLLEKEFAAMMGSKYALAVASCSAALFLTLRGLELSHNAKVLIPAFTFAAVPSAVIHANCTPVLVEVNDNYRIDVEDFAAKFTDDIEAVLISHMRGHTSDMDAIKALCDEKDIPLIEDAAHSLGTTWNGQKIGTIGKVGCFSFQSYKLVNGGEGGILVTDDADMIAKCVIMSGAYESNWQKHGLDCNAFSKYQNELPLYNTRMSNLSAAVIRPQLKEVERRVDDGLRNHDSLANQLNSSPYFDVPEALAPEKRAPDSIQFNLIGFTNSQAQAFMAEAHTQGVPVSIFGLHTGNARAYWNWKFLGETPELPKTKAMLARACDVRLPAALTLEEVNTIGDVLLASVEQIKSGKAA
ncbi:aminotransferase class I/II-fold pyridoxal phosphate-dependent enzyme [Amylibacter sp. SFDW26]|uniref:DegT/DnrJ/EryC1/StrS family aminotransferase n=1 Tax=Amylibacter sp. SFDW26 TaxID=2652722 RepID=UPI001261DE9C|nr:aminotransferase class I/II-fold pyridoxal phosphate-dependent enzyme [Amylibacter sp. SFDW26]KAB7615468.1 aminotransferase class I/II-fold pyridoxal phosphate-dependent enzyme [Amylibacter sp. SFDW26]